MDIFFFIQLGQHGKDIALYKHKENKVVLNMSIVYFVPFRGSEDVNIFNVGHRNWIQQGSPLIHFPYL